MVFPDLKEVQFTFYKTGIVKPHDALLFLKKRMEFQEVRVIKSSTAGVLLVDDIDYMEEVWKALG